MTISSERDLLRRMVLFKDTQQDAIDIMEEIWDFYSTLNSISNCCIVELIIFLGTILNSGESSLEAKDISLCFLRNILRVEFASTSTKMTAFESIYNNHSNWFRFIIHDLPFKEAFNLIVSNCYSSSSSNASSLPKAITPFLPSLDDWKVLFDTFDPFLSENEEITQRLIQIPSFQDGPLFLYIFPPIKSRSYSPQITKLIFICFLKSLLLKSLPFCTTTTTNTIVNSPPQTPTPLTQLIVKEHEILFSIIEELNKRISDNPSYKDIVFQNIISRFHGDLEISFKERLFSLFSLSK